MNTIETFEHFKFTSSDEHVYCIQGGQCNAYIIIGYITRFNAVAIINKNNRKDIRLITKSEFESCIWLPKYNSKEVGEIMISQIKHNAESEIESIKSVYMNDEPILEPETNP